MIRIVNISSCLSVVAFLLSGGPALAAATLGDAANAAHLYFIEGTFDANATPEPVTYGYSKEQAYLTNPAGMINESMSSADRSASVNVTSGIIKASASSTGITNPYYVHGALAQGSFIDTFSINSNNPGQQWVEVTFRLFVDGATRSSGGPKTYNRGLVQGYFDVTTAPGGQLGGSIKIVSDFELFPRTVETPCLVSPTQETCALGTAIGRNSAADYDGYQFLYRAIVKTNEVFTLEAGMVAGAFSLAPGEWATSDFASTAIFGGLEVGSGFTVTSLAAGGTLGMLNGIANYDAAFAALTDKYGTATPGAVPEPGIWAMLIAGFAMAGGLMRRRPMAMARVSIA